MQESTDSFAGLRRLRGGTVAGQQFRHEQQHRTHRQRLARVVQGVVAHLGLVLVDADVVADPDHPLRITVANGTVPAHRSQHAPCHGRIRRWHGGIGWIPAMGGAEPGLLQPMLPPSVPVPFRPSMLKHLSQATLLACAVAVSLSAQTATADQQDGHVRLQYGVFDPLSHQPEVPLVLRSGAEQRLWIVQFAGVPTAAGRAAIAAAGGEVIGYVPSSAYVVRMSGGGAENVREIASVRWVGSYHPAYRLEPALLAAQAWQQPEAVKYNVVVADKRKDKPGLIGKIKALGGSIDHEQQGSLLLEVTLTGPQLLMVAGLDEVLWIDRWTPTGNDMDNARIQGGGNYIETQGGYTGTGVNAHIYEGIEATHPDFTGGAINVDSGGAADTHGHATAGIVFGNGTSNPAVRGMAPNCGKFYTNYGSVTLSRWQVVSNLVNVRNVSHTTASWGNTQTTAYTSVSADADDIIFDHDIAWTQSQSNTGNQNSRPQAWAKNIFSIGGVQHSNDSNPANDSWDLGNASIGPAADGRMKPDLCAYYDNIGTSDRTGSAGYSSGNWSASFGGTSGATPIVAGHNVLAIEMFTDEIAPGIGQFGNPLRVTGGSSHQNRPHFTTLKALQIVSAAQYTFNSGSTDNRREHQGWGFPDLRKMWDNRNKTFIVDETSALVQGGSDRWNITVAPGEPALKVCVSWSEPAGNPAVLTQLINNLSLLVTSPSGTQYWGNNGLTNGMWSVAGGAQDAINSLECVFVQNPQAGVWTVDVVATSIVQDAKVETPIVDADYGLVVSGGTGQPGTGGQLATVTSIGTGCGGSPGCPDGVYEFPSFDLANSAFTLDYNAGNYTLVPAAGTWIAPAGTNLALGDDTEVTQALAFSLPSPGGATSSIRICSNGWVTSGTYTGGSNYVPTVATFLTNHMWAALWRDLNPAAGGAVWFDGDSSRAVITWSGVPNFGAAGTSSTFQMQFWASGDVHVIYQGISVVGDYLVGYSKANASDPGSTDLSASLNAGIGVCGVPVPPVPSVALNASARPITGTTFNLVTTNAPTGTLLGLSILSLNQITPPLDLGFLGMLGCSLYQQLDVVDVFPIVGSTGQRSFTVPNVAALAGTVVRNQAATATPGINSFGFVTSNGLVMTVGLN
jgi:serine protease AprX